MNRERKPFEFDIAVTVDPDELDPDDDTLRSAIATALCCDNRVTRIEFTKADGTTEVWAEDTAIESVPDSVRRGYQNVTEHTG